MTSQINYSAIVTTFPVAGQDNNSQGFRDNFAATYAALETANTEITALQTNGIDVTQPTNDLQKTTLYDGYFNCFYGIFNNRGTVSGTTNIDLTLGPIQEVTLSGNAVLNFINWPGIGYWGAIRVIVINPSTSVSAYNITLQSENSGVIWVNTGLTNPTTISINQIQVIEAWSVNGTDVYVKNVGTYSAS